MSDTSVSSATSARVPAPQAGQNKPAGPSNVQSGSYSDDAPAAPAPRVLYRSDSATGLAPNTPFDLVNQLLGEVKQQMTEGILQDERAQEIRSRCAGDAKKYDHCDHRYVDARLNILGSVARTAVMKKFGDKVTEEEAKEEAKEEGNTYWSRMATDSECARLNLSINMLALEMSRDFLEIRETPKTS